VAWINANLETLPIAPNKATRTRLLIIFYL
jgi:hypothetical protein